MTREEAIEILQDEIEANKRFIAFNIGKHELAYKREEEINEALEALIEMDKIRHADVNREVMKND